MPLVGDHTPVNPWPSSKRLDEELCRVLADQNRAREEAHSGSAMADDFEIIADA
jgi:hypothetical protein